MSTTNGKLTYSKTPFKEKLHKRASGGTFEAKDKTEKDKVDYHHAFSGKEHPRKSDGSFVKNTYKSEEKTVEDSEGIKNGKRLYGR